MPSSNLVWFVNICYQIYFPVSSMNEVTSREADGTANQTKQQLLFFSVGLFIILFLLVFVRESYMDSQNYLSWYVVMSSRSSDFISGFVTKLILVKRDYFGCCIGWEYSCMYAVQATIHLF